VDKNKNCSPSDADEVAAQGDNRLQEHGVQQGGQNQADPSSVRSRIRRQSLQKPAPRKVLPSSLGQPHCSKRSVS